MFAVAVARMLRDLPKAALCVLAAGLCGMACARTVHPFRQYELASWTTRQGLPQNSIRKIAQTADGYLWFSTWEGLVRFDGSDFETFDRGSLPGMSDNALGALRVDDRGRLWFGDSRGNLGCRKLDGSWVFHPHPADAPQTLIQSLRPDGSGGLWLLYEGGGLAHVDARGVWRVEPESAGGTLSGLHGVIERDAAGGVWAGSYDGPVYRDTQGVGHRIAAEFGLPARFGWPYLAPDGTLWLVDGDAIYRAGTGGVSAPRLAYDLTGRGRPTALLQDHQGALWVGTEDHGLLRIADGRIETLPPGLALPTGRVLSLAEDREASIWIGTNGGLFRLRPTLFGNRTVADGLSGNYVRTVLEDRAGTLWVGTGSGLDRLLPDGRIEHVDLPTGNGRPPEVLSLAEGKAPGGGDAIWVGTFGDGLYRVDGAGHGLARFGHAEGLPAGSIRAIDIDAHGIVRVGTQDGVRLLDGDRLIDPGTGGGLVTALLADAGGEWVGTPAGLRFLPADGGLPRSIDLQSVGGGRAVFALTRIGDAVWVSSDRGLYRLRGGRVAHIGIEQGLGADTVFDMVADRRGFVWLTGNRGLWRVSLDALDAVADGRASHVSVRHYGVLEGMVSAQVNGSSSPSAVLRADGTLWVATAGGLSEVDPAAIDTPGGDPLRSLPAPAVLIRQVAADGVQARADRPLHLRSGQRLSIDYVALTSVMPDRVLYRTWLDGLEPDWVGRGHTNTVEFDGLRPGRFTLRIEAAHPDGRWSDRAASLSVVVEPLWWQRPMVRAGFVVLAVAAIAALFGLAMRRHVLHARRLRRLVAERTRELQHQTERLLGADREKSDLLERLRRQSQALARQALEDSLTGLANRRAFDMVVEQRLQEAVAADSPFAVVLLDLDRFKQINDAHSHQTGDAVLREAAEMLETGAETGGFVARTGGEEFAILVLDGRPEALCDRLRTAFHARDRWAGIDGLRVTFSAGIAARTAQATVEDLLVRADAALYRAKLAGRDRAYLG